MHLYLLIRWVRLKRKRWLKHLLTQMHSSNQKLIGSLRLRRSCFVIQRLTLRLIDSLKQRHWYLLTHRVMLIRWLRLKHWLTLRCSMNRKLIGSLRLRHSYFVIQKLTLRPTDSLKLKHWYLMTRWVMLIHWLRLKHLLTLRRSMSQKLIDSLRLKRLCFAIQRLTLRRID